MHLLSNVLLTYPKQASDSPLMLTNVQQWQFGADPCSFHVQQSNNDSRLSCSRVAGWHAFNSHSTLHSPNTPPPPPSPTHFPTHFPTKTFPSSRIPACTVNAATMLGQNILG